MHMRPPPVLDYETPPPTHPLWRQVFGRVFDPGRVICCFTFVLIMMIPIVRQSERPTMIVVAVALVMFIAGMRGEKPLT